MLDLLSRIYGWLRAVLRRLGGLCLAAGSVVLMLVALVVFGVRLATFFVLNLVSGAVLGLAGLVTYPIRAWRRRAARKQAEAARERLRRQFWMNYRAWEERQAARIARGETNK